MRNIDIDKPDHVVHLKDLSDPEQVYEFFKQHGIKKYNYGFKCHNITVKYGLSGRHGGRMIPGERVRGQCAQLSGWTFNKDDKKIGREFIEVTDQLGATNKDLFTVEIWDHTNEPDETFNPDFNIEHGESTLLEQFEAQHKRLPIGNRKNEIVPAGVAKETFDSLFE
jgi:hypothetical protein